MTPTMYFVEFITFNHCIHRIPNFTVDSLKISVVNFKIHMLCTKSLPIMLALCSMLLPSYYAPNYAGIIGSGLSCALLSMYKLKATYIILFSPNYVC